MGLWSKIKQVALTDVRVLVRGMGKAELDVLERTLIESDLGVPASMELVADVTEQVRRGALVSAEDVRGVIEERLVKMLDAPELPRPGELRRAAEGPTVVLLVGVNGAGKTTAAAKLGRRLAKEGRKVLLVAADTYRAGAVAQLDEWAERLGLPCVRGQGGQDPAAVAFDGIDAAVTRGLDTVVIDTAGRLHTQEGLMKELQKVARVSGKRAPGAPHETLLVLDGTAGQNAVQQGRVFAQALPISGLIVTKLDGTARGGTVVALRRELNVPVRFIGTGERPEDLEVFDARRYAQRLLDD